jgi:hypothetical protein
LDEEYKEKIKAKSDENNQEVEFLENFREKVCQELECKTEKDLINKSKEFIDYIRNVCSREIL